MNTKERIIHYLEEYHMPKRKGVQLTGNTMLLEEKVLDSLGMLEMISFVEETFNIEIPEDDIIPDHFGTIERLSQYIESHKTDVEPNR